MFSLVPTGVNMPAEGGILLNKKAQQEHHNGNPGDKGDARKVVVGRAVITGSLIVGGCPW